MQPERVQQQLERILASGHFGQSEALVRLLRFLVVESLAGRSDRLKEYTLGVEVFQRGVDFDPRIDTIVRTQVRRLRAKLETYYSARAEDEIVIALPKGTYVPVFRSRCSPPSAKRSRILPVAVILLLILIGGTAAHRETMQPSIPHAEAPARLQSTGSSESYRLYLKGRYERDPEQAMSYLEGSLRADSQFAPAWLAQAEIHMKSSRHALLPPSLVLPKAAHAAARTIALGHDTAKAHLILASVASILDWDFARAEGEFLIALRLDPFDGWARLQYAHLLAVQGRTHEALDQVRHIGAVDPNGSVMAASQAAIFLLARDYDRVLTHCAAVLDAAPDAVDCHFWMGRAFLAKGMPEEAIRAFEKRRTNESQGFSSPITAYLAAGRRREALRLRQFVEHAAGRQYVSPVSLAQMHFAFGETEAGFRHLERGLHWKDHSMLSLKQEPIYDPIRNSPRFQKILRTIGL